MNFEAAIARPGTAVMDRDAITFSFTPEIDSPITVFWDVTAASKYLAAMDAKAIPLPLEGLEHWFEENRIEIDRTHAMGMRED